MALTLYHNDMSVCAQRVRFTLAEKGLAFDSRHLDLRAGDQKDPQYLKRNPNGYVPTLVHDGFVLCESSVIGDYIDDAFPAPALAAHGKPWLAGEMFTAADIGNAPYLTRLDHLRLLGPMTARRPLSAADVGKRRTSVAPGESAAYGIVFGLKPAVCANKNG